MGGILGITGTPGTGKKSIAPLAAKKLGVSCLGLNELAATYGLFDGSDPEGKVDTKELAKRLAHELRDPAVVYGHLVPYALSPTSVARVVVLRCEPAALKARLIARRYPPQKVVDNVEAELIGLVSSDAFDAFGRSMTFEVDTTGTTPSEASGTVAGVLRGDARLGPRIDWTANYDSGAKLRSLLSMEET